MQLSKCCHLESRPNASEPSRTAVPSRDRQPLRWLCHDIVTYCDMISDFRDFRDFRLAFSVILSMPSQSGCALKETVWKVTFHLNVNIYIDTFSKVCIYASNLLIMTVLEHAQTLFIMVLDNRWLSLYIKKHGLLLFQADDGLLSPCFGLSFCCNPYRKVLACWYHPFLALERA